MEVAYEAHKFVSYVDSRRGVDGGILERDSLREIGAGDLPPYLLSLDLGLVLVT